MPDRSAPSARTPGEGAERPLSRTPYQKLAQGLIMLATTAGVIGGLVPLAAAAAPLTVTEQSAPAQDPALRAPVILAQVETAPGQEVPEAEALVIIKARDQQLLHSGRMLKYDQFPTLHTPALQSTREPQPLIPGAPNFRKVNGENTYGVAQPTVEGLKSVLTRLGAQEREVMWTTMREEPLIYINGRSLTLRDFAHPFANLEQTGTTAEQVEAQENQLKQEILREAARNGGRLLIQDETQDERMISRWVEVGPQDVQTPREVFDGLRSQGFRVNYARVPISDEKAPEDADLDALVARFRGLGADTPAVFNCHAGRGRTTTGMIVADLMRHAQDDPPAEFLRQQGVRQDVREQGQFQRGEYRVILGLIKALQDGPTTKAQADAIIDRAAALQNLRESIEGYKEKGTTNARAAERGKDYLYRYYKLITFNAYLREQAPRNYEQSFTDWLKAHPELNVPRETLELALGFSPSTNHQLA